MKTKVTPHEALIYVMVAVSAVDGRVTDLELQEISDLVERMPAFFGLMPEKVPAIAQNGLRLLAEDEGMGLDSLVEIVRDSLTPPLYETAYALAVEVAAVDLVAEQEELRFLEMMRDALEIDMLVAAAIERSARVRYRRIG